MPITNCDVVGCDFATEDVGDAVAAVQLGRHYALQHPIAAAVPNKPPHLPLPKITGQINQERFTAFKAEWSTYKTTANLQPGTETAFLATTMERRCEGKCYHQHQTLLEKLKWRPWR